MSIWMTTPCRGFEQLYARTKVLYEQMCQNVFHHRTYILCSGRPPHRPTVHRQGVPNKKDLGRPARPRSFQKVVSHQPRLPYAVGASPSGAPSLSGASSPAGASPPSPAGVPSPSPSPGPPGPPMPPRSTSLGAALFLPTVVAASMSPVARNSPSVMPRVRHMPIDTPFMMPL